jgi:hypothetical protein
MLRLSDAELDVVMNAAKPIARDRRDAFLQAVATELARYPGELGVGLVHRIVAEIQRAHFEPPHLERSGVWSKYA